MQTQTSDASGVRQTRGQPALSEKDIAAIRQHLTELLEGPSFSGTQRSAQFLRYVVEHALAGEHDLLKERTIGAALFGRDPSYETKVDAIVRVTAIEVRKRLEQHYQKNGLVSKFRIDIPPGSYSPVFWRVPQTRQWLTAPAPATARLLTRSKLPWGWIGLAALLFAAATASAFAVRFLYRRAAGPVLPWSLLFQSSRPLEVIASDPNQAEIAWLTGKQISLSDYANHIYIPQPNKLTPDAQRISEMVLRGDKASLVDTSTIADVAALASARSRAIEVHGARSIQLTDLKTDGNFLFLGSPRSDPWTSLFSSQLDFRFDFNDDPHVLGEFIRNARPRAGEKDRYDPTAPGWATGDSFAIMAFIQNPGKNGQVLLLQGLSAEATRAVGQLATDPPALSSALRRCRLSASDGLRHFELLLRVNTMAGQPMQTDVMACHVLSDPAAPRP